MRPGITRRPIPPVVGSGLALDLNAQVGDRASPPPSVRIVGQPALDLGSHLGSLGRPSCPQAQAIEVGTPRG